MPRHSSHRHLFEASVDDGEEGEGEGEEPRLHFEVAFLFICVSVTLIIFLTEFFVGALAPLSSEQAKPTPQWIGLVLVPLASTFSRQDIFESAKFAQQGRTEECIGMTIGASVHLAHLVMPFLVLLSWILGKNLSMLFDPFQSITLFLSVLIGTFVCMDGKGNYLKGLALVVLYVAVAVTYWFYPGQSSHPELTLPCT